MPADDDAESGSILLLTIGYALLALVLVLVCVDATSLYLAQKRTQAVADAAALAGADGFIVTVEGGAVRAELTDDGVAEQAAALVRAYGDAAVVDAGTPDGLSARVSVTTRWRPPVAALFVPDGLRLEATATSRTALR
ncbi:pilus assembly protein TadG-related protein [Microbacterium sp. 179-B 1A2 NHS]|uniref:pilus assembly protein TadG-related protein n=1 Tax=Microbacterium sp. 179-B 1A2 NHS TaxID=3142383 RepID=UPI0039A1FF60